MYERCAYWAACRRLYVYLLICEHFRASKMLTYIGARAAATGSGWRYERSLRAKKVARHCALVRCVSDWRTHVHATVRAVGVKDQLRGTRRGGHLRNGTQAFLVLVHLSSGACSSDAVQICAQFAHCSCVFLFADLTILLAH